MRAATAVQAAEHPERLSAAINDYGYMPAFNVLTPEIIQLLKGVKPESSVEVPAS